MYQSHGHFIVFFHSTSRSTHWESETYMLVKMSLLDVQFLSVYVAPRAFFRFLCSFSLPRSHTSRERIVFGSASGLIRIRIVRMFLGKASQIFLVLSKSPDVKETFPFHQFWISRGNIYPIFFFVLSDNPPLLALPNFCAAIRSSRELISQLQSSIRRSKTKIKRETFASNI